MDLIRIEKLALITLGVLVPLLIIYVTVTLLLEDTAIFIGRGDNLLYFYSLEAYLVSTLWFGIALGLITHFLLRYTVFQYQQKQLTFLYSVALALITTGLLSSIYFTLNTL